MGMRILHLSDIHLGSGQSYGRLNPQTGLNTRVEDVYRALATAMDQALALPVDVVLFTGDAFPDATPPPVIQELLARQFLRAVAAQIPVVLLVGNHDQHKQGEGGASLSIYRALNVPGVIVGNPSHLHPDNPQRSLTGGHPALDYPFHAADQAGNPGLIHGRHQQPIAQAIAGGTGGEIVGLDPDIPAILAAHVMVEQAVLGAERFLSPGKTFTVPLSLVAQPCFRYVALGHVHRHQVLWTEPPVVYAGSIERVDFGEEKEAKGYVLVDIEPTETRWQFLPLAHPAYVHDSGGFDPGGRPPGDPTGRNCQNADR